MHTSDKEKDFIEKIKKIYPSNWEKVISSHKVNKPKTFRVNTLLSPEKDVINLLEKNNFMLKKSEIPFGYISLKSPDDKSISKSNVFESNLIYIQELASMLPILVLDPEKTDSIMDFCAAPGSKTGLIAAITNNEAKITAAEKGRNRFFKMKELLDNQGVKNVRTILMDSNLIAKKMPDLLESFDKILVDAPCSNEGSLNLSSESGLKYWSEKEPKKLSKLQKGLLNSALKLLKPGGTLVYSTCTYSVDENEQVVDWALKRWPNVKLVDIELPITNVEKGRVVWNEKKMDKSLDKTVRVLPNEEWNGFFIAKMVKKDKKVV
ncbi:MAG: RsmB/NOP family class I SAM-dependent RNA methyltransferase [Candidatus Dojkabacteria bacterium]